MTGVFPDWIEPMAATLTQKRFTGPEWIFERKLDGIRVLAFKHGREVRLLSRNRLPLNASYPAVVEAMGRLPYEQLVLDGEATGVWGGRGRVAYHVFDLLWVNGTEVMSLPLERRRELLRGLPLRAPLERVESLEDPRPWERACREGWEGVIAKRRDAPYEHRRSPHWLKMKCEATQELVIGGFTDPQGKRVGLGALLVGYFQPRSHTMTQGGSGDEVDFVFAGKLGTGFDTALLLDLRSRLDTLAIPGAPFTIAVGLPRLRVHWVRPEIVVQVAFLEWTTHGKLRHPRLLGIRSDKSAHEVVREAP
jgi:bifunctional non-homologous end joining protein LigD